jgi:hypothetical protein
MRKAFLLLAALGLTSSLWAADPIIGTWKLNFGKTEDSLPESSRAITTQELPKEVIETYREIEEDLLEFTNNRVFENGSSRSTRWTIPKAGGKATPRILPEPLPDERSYVYTKLKTGEWVVTVMDNNIQILVIHKIVSKDGKIMKEIRLYDDPQGNTAEFVTFYDKQ